MAAIRIVPFRDEHVEDAAALLAARHTRHRTVEPLLPPQYEDAPHARAEIEAVWGREHTSGTAAFREEDAVGYLIGAPRESWPGENVWVEAAGHAAEDPEVVRDLYAAAAADWVDAGRAQHYTLVPNDPRLIDAWFRLGFGAQHAHGIRELVTAPPVEAPPGIELRRAGPDDVEDGAVLELVLPEHQQRSPVFSAFTPGSDEEVLEEWAQTLADDRTGTFLAWRQGRPVAGLVIAPAAYSGAHTGLARPDDAAILGWAATVDDERGTGIGRALTDAGLAWAYEQGYRTVVVDWRETNLLSSRFWPARGFRRTFLRLYRAI